MDKADPSQQPVWGGGHLLLEDKGYAVLPHATIVGKEAALSIPVFPMSLPKRPGHPERAHSLGGL